MNPLVSVIIPVYKVEKYLDRCIESVVNQTYKNLEIILVDDGSPDNCPAMCDTWAERDARIKVIHKKNGGLSDARNVALDIVKGEYVTFVDSDDMILPNAVELFIHTLSQNRCDTVLTAKYISFYKDFDVENAVCDDIQIYNSKEALGIMFCDIKRWEAWGTLYSKSLFETLRFPFGRLYEDVFVIPRAVYNSNKVAIIDAKVYCYYSNPESIMRSGNKKAIVKADLYYGVSEMVELFKQIADKTQKNNAIAGILEELLSRVHLACSNRSENEDFIYPSKRLARQNIKYILFSKKISLKRKVFMFLVLCGVSHKIFK